MEPLSGFCFWCFIVYCLKLKVFPLVGLVRFSDDAKLMPVYVLKIIHKKKHPKKKTLLSGNFKIKVINCWINN